MQKIFAGVFNLNCFTIVETGASDAGTLTDLEVVYNCIEERENDFKVAAQIGQMLVERNSQLMDELEGAKRDWEAEVILFHWVYLCLLSDCFYSLRYKGQRTMDYYKI